MAQKDFNADLHQVNFESLPEDVFKIKLLGRLDSEAVGRCWGMVFDSIAENQPAGVIVDVEKVDYCDSTGAAFINAIKNRAETDGKQFQLVGASEHIAELVSLVEVKQPVDRPGNHWTKDMVIDIGRGVALIFGDVIEQISFVGQFFSACFYMITHPKKMRWKDFLLVAEQAGANALGIVILLSFLLGLILAFQSAIPLKRFGAQVYVADLVAISVIRELGPLITAIILAGRSSSAFAAEIGTMKINEEIDALTTMGLDPVKFLTVSRVSAAVVIMPLLTVFANFFALIGCGVVMLSLGFPLVTYLTRIEASVTSVDLYGGLVKSLFFGLFVAAVGCLRGLQTRSGASAVGVSTTRAVVSSIVLIVAVDGIFAVVYYYLGI